MKLYIVFLQCLERIRARASEHILGFFLIILMFGAANPTSHAQAKNIEVISSSETGFHFRIALDPAGLNWFADEDSLWTGYTTVQVGVPYGTQPRVVLSRGSELSELGENYLQGKSLSGREKTLVEIGEPATIRGRQIAGIRIYPVVGGAMYREVEVKLTFEGTAPTDMEAAADPHFEKIFRAVLANYDQFRAWPVSPRPASKPTAIQAGPFDPSNEWYKLSVNQTGLHKLTGAQLEAAGLSLSEVSSDEIKMFSGGGMPLEFPNDQPRPVFTEISILVRDGQDGWFDRDDYVLFFGEAQDRWVYSADAAPEYIDNPYCDHNVYWLTVSGGSGLRMQSTNSMTPGTFVDTYRNYEHVEQDNLLRKLNVGRVSDYYNWYWTDQQALTFWVPVSGLVPDDTANVSISARTGGSYVDLWVNGEPAINKLCGSRSCTFGTTSLLDGSNQVTLALYPAYEAPPYLNYFEVNYSRENLPVNDKLDLTLGTSSEILTVEVANEFSSDPLVLDVSNPLQPRIVDPMVVNTDYIEFSSEGDLSVYRRYYLTPENSAATPISVRLASPVDLYAISQQVDLIVVTPRVFMSSLEPYLDYRRAGGYTVAVAAVEDIMDNFAFGMYDPTAIRDFLKFAYENYPSPAPSAVLFVGDANYDYLDILGTGTPNYLPPHISSLDYSASDDNYVYFGYYGILDSDTSYLDGDRGFDMICSRWPVRSQQEIQVITDKIARYESASQFGIWRNKITLVADDERAGSSSSLETIHVLDTEELENEHIPALFTRDKIYLWEYPFVGREKPEVNDAIVRAINDGSLMVNYVGHGNPDVWAHEHVLWRGVDLPRLNNRERLPLVFVASCAIGYFDDPSREGMAEDFLTHSNGGAVGIIAATRLVYASANADFNQETYDKLLYADSLSICEAVYAAKLARQYLGGVPSPITNDRKFLFFGEPFVRLAVPRLDIEVTATPDTLLALGKTVVAGRVVDENLATYAHDGVLYVEVLDSERDKVYRVVNSDGSIMAEVEYAVTGPTIHRGSATIDNGEFSFDFLAPLDIGYGGDGARILVYAQFDNIDGAGIIDSIAVSDSVASSDDVLGPTVEISFLGRQNFISGDPIAKDARMRVVVSDPSGVNLTGSIGHGITMEIDRQSENTVNLTPLFESYRDNYTTGELEYQFEGLTAGNHHFKIKAWDNANNSTAYEFDAEVLTSGGLAIRELLNYPNPMKESTRFSFYLTQPTEKFSLELCTLSGRKIKSFFRYALEPGYHDDIEWYGTDADGSRVATEVYIYKATAYPAAGGEKVESFGKLILIN
ncbi:MAG: type IX secretion system sortase PorU [Candidatus Zixiibacteriota bacterium]|nr:MAG: type IX secretion system sortase PorU [candidate division Zixibacteria bacterium]